MDFWISKWISGFQSGFLDFKADFWISQWISGFQLGFLDFWISVWISADGVRDFFRNVTDPSRKMAEMASPEPKKRRTGDDLPSTAATNRFSGKVAIVTGGASGRSQLLLPIKSVLCVH